MSTQRWYVDKCEICGRRLEGNGSKVYWPAYRIREENPKFRGGEVIDPTLGIPRERGGMVCRARARCVKTR